MVALRGDQLGYVIVIHDCQAFVVEEKAHYAGVGANVAAAITLNMSGLLDVSARNLAGYTPAHFAATSGQPRVLEVPCAAGADLWARDAYGLSSSV